MFCKRPNKFSYHALDEWKCRFIYGAFNSTCHPEHPDAVARLPLVTAEVGDVWIYGA